MFNVLKKLRKLKNIEFYNYETGKRYSYWVGIPIHLLLVVCFLVVIRLSILLTCEIRDHLKTKTYNEKCQAYSIAVSPKPINMPCVHTRNGFSVFVADTHLKAFVKDKNATDDV